MPPLKPNKSRLCRCGCGEPVKLVYDQRTGVFKGYGRIAPTCPFRNSRLHAANPAKGRKGAASALWKPDGSTSLHTSGGVTYRKIKVAGTWRYEHRYVMEQMLGRPLRAKEHVHHKDQNPLNNHPSNLEVLSPSAHRLLHNHLKAPTWSQKYGDACLRCNTTTRRHYSFGLCTACYQKWDAEQHPERRRRYSAATYAKHRTAYRAQQNAYWARTKAQRNAVQRASKAKRRQS